MSFIASALGPLLSPRKTLDKIAVIDLGSNSVRMVVYDGLKRTPLPLFNEKVLCGLARGMSETGKLNPIGIESAKRAVRRFCFISRSMNVKKIYTLATSAVRDASDGELFREELEKYNDISVKVISGEEEARLSTLGILSSIYDPEGVVGDLGGGSLEVSFITRNPHRKFDIGGFKSFPIGPLRLKNKESSNSKQVLRTIDSYLEDLPLFKEFRGSGFYAVGGGFRALAKIHITKNNYPLRVLHNYKVKTDELKTTIDSILKMSPAQLKSIHVVSENRIETLTNTALIASRIISHLKPSHFVFSVHGIREGFLHDLLSDSEKMEDPLIACATDMIEHISTDARGVWPKFGYELFEWMSPLFNKEPIQVTRLRLAACILSRIAWYEHTEYRAEMAFRTILDSEIAGISHSERVFLATAAYHRYKSTADKNVTAKIHSLLTKEQIKAARIIGLTVRLGMNITGGAPDVIKHSTISRDKSKLIISCSGDYSELIGETVDKRFKKLADALSLEPAVHFSKN